jgi:EmrB/QacA subfamily drug resistance transporter
MRQAWRTLSVVSMASTLTALNGSALNVVLPDLVRHFHATPVAASWVLLSFQLANTALMVIFGRLADIMGRRQMYLAGLAVYTLASLALGFSPGVWWLVALRVVQAAGAAMLITNSAALVTSAFPRRSLGTGMGIYIASFSVAQLIGPTVGGFLAGQFGWEWVFWFNVPLGVAGMIWGAVALHPARPDDPDRRMDLPGNVLVVVSLCALLIGLSEATELGWANPVVIGGVAAFVVLTPVLVWVERRAAVPVLDFRLFAERALAFGVGAALLNSLARFAVVLIVPLFFQAVDGESAIEAGLRVLPLSVVSMLASMAGGLWLRRVGARTVATLGCAVTTAGIAVLLVTLNAPTRYVPVAVGLVLVGIGSGAFNPSNTTALLHDVPDARIGIVNAVRLMMQNIGIVVGTALTLTIVASPLPVHLRAFVFAGTVHDVSADAISSLVTGYRWALVFLLVMSALTVVASAGTRTRRRGGPA